jgi:hypothetical protein
VPIQYLLEVKDPGRPWRKAFYRTTPEGMVRLMVGYAHSKAQGNIEDWHVTSVEVPVEGE